MELDHFVRTRFQRPSLPTSLTRGRASTEDLVDADVGRSHVAPGRA